MSQICKPKPISHTSVLLKSFMTTQAFQSYQDTERKISNFALSIQHILASFLDKSPQEIHRFLVKNADAIIEGHLQSQVSALKSLFSEKHSLLEKAMSKNPPFPKEKEGDFIYVLKAKDSDWLRRRIAQLASEKKACLIALKALLLLVEPILFNEQRIFRKDLPRELFWIPLTLAQGRVWQGASQKFLRQGKVSSVYTLKGPNNILYAKKIFYKPSANASATKEAFFLSQLSHTIPLVQLISSDQLIMQYAKEGTFAKYCASTRATLPQYYPWLLGPLLVNCLCTEFKPYFFQAVGAVHELHTKMNWCHRDIKAENFLMLDGRVKLCDFDLARKIQTKNDILGFSAYTAPETCYCDTIVSPQMDVWSLGVMMWQMCTGLSLCKFFGAQNTFSLAQSYTDVIPLELLAGNLHLAFGSQDNHAFFSLVQKMLHKDPSKRPSMAEVLKDAYFSSVAPSPSASQIPTNQSSSLSSSATTLSVSAASSSSSSNRTASSISPSSTVTTQTGPSPISSGASCILDSERETPSSSSQNHAPQERKDSVSKKIEKS